MLMPALFGENLFDDFFGFPDFRELEKMENRLGKRLYGHHEQNLMKVDVKDVDNAYEMVIDLPGFTKDEINASLENGYLTVTAAKGFDNDEKEQDTGRYIRRERYAGACSRSFYVGDGIRQEDIKAEFKHGILKLEIPKAPAQLPEKTKYIAIEG